LAELWDLFDENGNKTGRLHERGAPMQKGDYHLVVHVWIMNSDGKFLITKRTPGPNDIDDHWQTTGGCAVAGDGSKKTALKETEEETGLTLDPSKGIFFERYHEPHSEGDGTAILDVWFFTHDADIAEVVLQPGETCGAKWADKKEIIEMLETTLFRPKKSYPYLMKLFEYAESVLHKNF